MVRAINGRDAHCRLRGSAHPRSLASRSCPATRSQARPWIGRMMEGSQRYTAVEVEDSEFYAPDGEPLRPHCWASLDLLTGRRQSRWTGDGPTPSPDPPGARPLRIAHQVQAEAGHRLAVGWSMGAFIDTHVELRVLANGVGLVAGDGLLGARVLFGLPPGDAAEKDAGRALAMRPEVPLADRPALQKYNQGDVALLAELAERMWPL